MLQKLFDILVAIFLIRVIIIFLYGFLFGMMIL